MHVSKTFNRLQVKALKDGNMEYYRCLKQIKISSIKTNDTRILQAQQESIGKMMTTTNNDDEDDDDKII